MLLDVNGDGYIDLAALPRLGIGPHIWFGDGEGRWKENSWKLSATQTSCGGGFDFGDINGDGHLDMAVADHCNGIFVYLGDGQGGWIPIAQGLFPEDLLPGAQKRQMFQGAEDLVLGDVNGDGFPDIVSGAADEGGINVYLGNGTGDNWKRQDQTSLPASRWTVRVELADVNGDGIKDLLASHSVGPRVWLSDGKGGWTAASDGLPSPMIEGLYGGLSTGDFNEDGRVDIAVANWVDGPEVYLQQADGSWRKMPDVFPDMQGGAVGLDTDDLNQDGHLDLVVSGRLTTEGGFVRGIFALLGDGKGGFRFWENSGLPSTGLAASTGVTIGDVNQDGVPDIALASGLIVETGTGRSEPIVPERMLVWCSSPNSGSK
ncbi:MAG: VCBS repeat-containing protein [Phycisphaerae bacterium]|nr:VCBS repeat-containing protein [Phycisphaerae bacterium]